LSVVAKLVLRAGAYVAVAGIGTAAVMNLDDGGRSSAADASAGEVMSLVRTDVPATIMIPAGQEGADAAFVIDMAKFSPGGEHWSRMNSDDPVVREQAMAELHALYGEDFMMAPAPITDRAATAVAARPAGNARSLFSDVPLPPVRPRTAGQ
jgi:hypothetical protein